MKKGTAVDPTTFDTLESALSLLDDPEAINPEAINAEDEDPEAIKDEYGDYAEDITHGKARPDPNPNKTLTLTLYLRANPEENKEVSRIEHFWYSHSSFAPSRNVVPTSCLRSEKGGISMVS
jgi:hypothetical protein